MILMHLIVFVITFLPEGAATVLYFRAITVSMLGNERCSWDSKNLWSSFGANTFAFVLHRTKHIQNSELN